MVLLKKTCVHVVLFKTWFYGLYLVFFGFCSGFMVFMVVSVVFLCSKHLGGKTTY